MTALQTIDSSEIPRAVLAVIIGGTFTLLLLLACCFAFFAL